MKKVTKKKPSKTAPDYIERDGDVYERLSKKSKPVALDLAEDVVQKIDRLVDEGKYVSRGDAIRDILRYVINSDKSID